VELDAGSDDELTRRIKADAKDLEKNGDIKDEEWAVDVSAEAVKARANELPDDLKRSLAFDNDEDGEGGEGGHSAYDELGSWVISEAEKAGGVAKVKDVDIYVKAKDLGIETKHKTLTVLAQTIFDENMVKQIPKRAAMLKKVSRFLPTHLHTLLVNN
jgi:translation initiation factor 5